MCFFERGGVFFMKSRGWVFEGKGGGASRLCMGFWVLCFKVVYGFLGVLLWILGAI